MKCSFCGHQFDEKATASACGSCMMAKKCTLLKCPNCGYEMPKSPEWISKVGKMAGRLLHMSSRGLSGKKDRHEDSRPAAGRRHSHAISNKGEEILESLWVKQEEKKIHPVSLEMMKLAKDDAAVKEIVSEGLAEIKDSNLVFTDKGRKYGRDIVRRHRLAERLLADVLDLKGKLANEKACEFEHLLHKGIDDRICTLLGHPKLCPHGHSIPPGRCCAKEKNDIKIVSALSSMSLGQEGRIAYIHTGDDAKMQKMMAIGVVPGMRVALMQKSPSFLFRLGNSQFAVDESMAKEIFVRIEGEEGQD